MKKSVLLILMFLSLCFHSCRETEMNTDGNTEDADATTAAVSSPSAG